MLERTRWMGRDLIDAHERADEVLEAHDSNKGHAWREQTWMEHLRRAIAHMQNALEDKGDGTEIEAAHALVRAAMGLEKIAQRDEDFYPRRLCRSHAGCDRSQRARNRILD